MSEQIRILLSSVSAEWVTLTFSLVMFFVFGLGLVFHSLRKQEEFVEFIPSLLTSLGILGTFTGIILGLVEFDIGEIDESIALLLEGLKTAFLTSVLGIALSILFKTLRYAIPVKFPPEKETDIDDLYSIMDRQLQAVTQLGEKVDQNQTVQNQQLNEFLKNFAYESSKSLVGELKSIVTDFNDSINRQFGENFKEFGDSFKHFEIVINHMRKEFTDHENRLKTWSESCDQNIDSLSAVSKEISGLRGKLADIPEFLGSIEPVMEKGQAQLELVNQQLREYESISKNVAKIVPNIEGKISEFNQSIELIRKLLAEDIAGLFKQYQSSMSQAQEQVLAPVQDWQKTLTEIQLSQQATLLEWQNMIDSGVSELKNQYRDSMGAIKSQSESLSQHVSSINDVLNGLSKIDKDMVNTAIAHTLESHRSSMQDLAAHQAKTHREMSEYLAKIIADSLGQTELNVGKHLESVEHHMEREIEQVMKAMGDALATISGQFTRDYQTLIRQMKRVLDSAQVSA